jgi:hypothetical protein
MALEAVIDVGKTSYKESCKEIFPKLFGFNPLRSKEDKEKAKRIYASFLIAGISEERQTFLISFNSENFIPTESTDFAVGDGIDTLS